MQIMHGMSNLVEGLILGHNQLAILILSIFFEEWLHLPGGIEEVICSLIILSLEIFDLLYFCIKFVNDICHFIFHNLDCLGIVNVFEHCIAIDPEFLDCFRIHLFPQL